MGNSADVFEWLEENFGKYIWGAALRYHTGMWEPIDVFQEIMVKASIAIDSGKLRMSSNPEDHRRIKSFIITRAIDLVRSERYRQCTDIDQLSKKATNPLIPEDVVTRRSDLNGMEIDPPAPDEESKVAFEMEIIREVIRVRLTGSEAAFIEELVFPSKKTIDIAIMDQEEKRRDPRLRMNTRELKITTVHVAQALASKLGRKISPATVSRYKAEARAALIDLFAEKLSTP